VNGILKRAMENHQPVELIYYGANHKISQRVVRIVYISDTHIKAYCFTKRQLRMFRKENILSCQSKKVTA